MAGRASSKGRPRKTVRAFLRGRRAASNCSFESSQLHPDRASALARFQHRTHPPPFERESREQRASLLSSRSVETIAVKHDRRAERSHALQLEKDWRLRWRKQRRAMSRRLHAYAIACPKLPALAVISLSRAKSWRPNIQPPRPFKDRMGLAVSTLTTIFVPSDRDKESDRLQRVPEYGIDRSNQVCLPNVIDLFSNDVAMLLRDFYPISCPTMITTAPRGQPAIPVTLHREVLLVIQNQASEDHRSRGIQAKLG